MKALDSLRSRQAAAERNISSFEASLVKHAALWEAVERLAPDAIDFELESGWINVKATGNALLFRQLWKAFRTAGFQTEYRPADVKKELISVIWRIQKTDEYGHRKLDYDGAKVYFQFSSTVCKRVVVGKRKVEVEENIYEVQCS